MVEIEKSIDDFTKQRWCFWLDRNKLYLDRYYFLVRKTKRHKWEVIERYLRVSYGRDFSKCKILTAEEVPFTEEIKREALNAMINDIEVCLWDRN